MIFKVPIINAMRLTDGSSILLSETPHGINQILDLLGVQGHQRGDRGAGIGHRG